MAYPNTKMIWDDQTVKQTIPEVNTLDGKPVIMTVSSSDKGPEDFRTIDSKYIERYGDISFAKHGQAQAQIARILSAGGAIYHHRIVAPDSTLANLSCVGQVSRVSVQKTNSDGAKLYLTPDGEETTAAEGNEAIMINKAKVKYDVMAITDLATLVGVGNDPKEIANLTRNQVALENAQAAAGTPVNKDHEDDLSNMGHANITYTRTNATKDAKTTVVGKDGATVSKVYVRAGKTVNTITDFDKTTAVDVTTSATGAGFVGCDEGENTICVEYTDTAKYPDELFSVVVPTIEYTDDEQNTPTEATTTVQATTLLDRSALKVLVNTVQTTKNEDYTTASWKAFQNALTTATLALADDKAQTEISSARVNLKFAFDSLRTNAEVNAIPKKYLLWTVTDSGRGESGKRISITPNYQASKNATYTKYMMSVFEGTESTDTTLMFSMNPDIIDSGLNRRLDTVLNANSLQLRGVVFENDLNAFIKDVANRADVKENVVLENDVLFASTRKGKDLDWIEIDKDSAVLNSTYGLALQGGDNGSFGDAPMESEDYYKEVVKCFDGSANVDIYDLDNVTIHAIFDANYPAEVKRAIEGLVAFREDCFYFRDLGTGLKTLDDIIGADMESLKSKFCASYHNSYDVYDEYTKKQITVTCMYDLAPMFVAHYQLGVNRPMAGILNGFIFENAIANTINFIPKKIPSIDQPQELYDNNINYMKYYDGILTMDTERTSQEVDSDLSYVNNVLAIQDVMRLVRKRCPKIRYSFKTGDDFKKYQNDINQVLNTRTGFFDSLTMVYLEDMAATDSKCYFAAIKVDCKDFIESEYFKFSVI